ncbi:MAG: hypothetical protein VX223_13915 [Myxococcota bacterium]|nr:hypothetical protein [Myxococcota bacterium]
MSLRLRPLAYRVTRYSVALIGTLFAVVIWVWVQYLPGYLTSRLFAPMACGPARHALALICGFSIVPLGLFLLASVFGIPMDKPVIFAGASALNIGLLGILTPWTAPDIGRRDIAQLSGVALASAIFLLFGFRAVDAGDVLTTIQHCLYVIALHGIQSHPSESLPLFDAMTGDHMHFLIHHDTTGLAGLAQLLYEQRIGNVPILAVPIATLGMAGWFVVQVHATVATVYCIWLAAREVGASPKASALSAAIFGWATNVMSAYYVNENYFALTLAAFLLWTALSTHGRGLVLLAGLAIGHAVGVRHTAVLFLPGVVIGALWQPISRAERGIRLILGAASSGLAVAPWLYINHLMLGEILTHPKVQPDSGGRVVANTILGKTFAFKPLQWPFTSEVVRTSWNPFPTFIWIPLLIIRSFGQIASAVALLGLKKTSRRTAIVLSLFFVPHTLALAMLEGLDWEQITYVIAGLAPIGVWLALGIDRISQVVQQSTSRRWTLTATAALVLTIVGGSFALRDVDFPVDTRPMLAERGVDEPVAMPEIKPPQGQTKGTTSVAERLTQLQPWPEIPVWRTTWAQRLAPTMASIVQSADVPTVNGKPVYPTERAVVLSAYSKKVARTYDFSIAGGDSRPSNKPVRTAVWLHTMAFQFNAERLDVHVERLSGNYVVDLVPVGTSQTPRDFTFWLNPWYPPIKSITVTLNGAPYTDLRVLPWGGRTDEGEQMFIVTNYPPEVLDIIDVPYTVDPLGNPTGCGIWIFLSDVDGDKIETLSPGGATDMLWHGELEGVLRLPNPIQADRLYLFSEPNCSDHIPQYGDRWGKALPPFTGENGPLQIKLDNIW